MTTAAELEAYAGLVRTRFETWYPGAKDVLDKAQGVLIFPSILKAGIFGVGGEYGEGVLYKPGEPNLYYNIISASVGFQLGIQTRALILAFMTKEAMLDFAMSEGWTIGAEASVTVVALSAGETIDTNKLFNPVLGFIVDSAGLMYSLVLQGSKISRIAKY